MSALSLTPVAWSVWDEGHLVGRVERDGAEYVAIFFLDDPDATKCMQSKSRAGAVAWLTATWASAGTVAGRERVGSSGHHPLPTVTGEFEP